MGYRRVDQSGMAVLVWKPFVREALPPRFLRQTRRPTGDPGRVSVAAFFNGWCTGACSQCVTAREAVEGLEAMVDYREYDTSDPETMLSWGISSGLFVEGEPYRPCEPPCSSSQLRRDLINIAKAKSRR
jgi:hypothetical protein